MNNDDELPDDAEDVPPDIEAEDELHIEQLRELFEQEQEDNGK